MRNTSDTLRKQINTAKHTAVLSKAQKVPIKNHPLISFESVKRELPEVIGLADLHSVTGDPTQTVAYHLKIRRST